MLRNRTMSNDSSQKDQRKNHWMSDDVLGSKHKNNSHLNVPCLFMGYSGRNSDSDSVKSPTSTLDFRTFSSFVKCHEKRSVDRKSWHCSKVGLSIVNSLDDEPTKHLFEVKGSSHTKSIVFGKQMNANSLNFCRHFDSPEKSNSLPATPAALPRTELKPVHLHKSDSTVLFEIGEAHSLDSRKFKMQPSDFGKRGSILASGNLLRRDRRDGTHSEFGFLEGNFELDGLIPTSIRPGTSRLTGFTHPDEIELSEDYTCVRTHGSNPTITHIFGDRILECCNDKLGNFLKKNEDTRDGMEFLKEDRNTDDFASSYLDMDFLKFCYSCKKTLDGEDIFMYRGDKAFCSCSCRAHEMVMDEDTDEAKDNSDENLHLT